MKVNDKAVQDFIKRAHHESQEALEQELKTKGWDLEVVRYVHFKWIDIYSSREREKISDEMQFFGSLLGISLLLFGVAILLFSLFWRGDAVLQSAKAQSRAQWAAGILISLGIGIMGKDRWFGKGQSSPIKKKRKKRFNPFRNDADA